MNVYVLCKSKKKNWWYISHWEWDFSALWKYNSHTKLHIYKVYSKFWHIYKKSSSKSRLWTHISLSMEKETATHSSIIAWKIPWTEESGRLQFMGSQSDTTERLHSLTHHPQRSSCLFVIILPTLPLIVLCLVAQSCPTLCNPMDCSLPGSSVHGDSPGKNIRVGCHALLQGIFPTQGSNPGLPHYRCYFYHLSHQRNPPPFPLSIPRQNWSANTGSFAFSKILHKWSHIVYSFLLLTSL